MPELLAGVSHQAYHADELPGAPHFSRSVAVTLLERSPLHAWSEHPKLGGGLEKEPTKEMDMGTLIHALLLGSGPEVTVADAEYKDWRTKDAKSIKAEALAAGRLPVLRKDWEIALEAAGQLGRKLVDLDIPIAVCDREATILWEEDGIACKARLDYSLITSAGAAVWDLKTKELMNVGAFRRSTLSLGLDMQAHAYLAGLAAARPETAGRATFSFVIVEWKRPWDVAIIPADASLLALGAARWARAKAIWRQALESGDWHGTGLLAPLEPPPQALEAERSVGLSNEEKLDALFGEGEEE